MKLTAGWVCDKCARANCRYRWEVCECRACGRHLSPQSDADIVPAASILVDREDVLGEADEASPDLPMSVRRISVPRATVIAYTLPQV